MPDGSVVCVDTGTTNTRVWLVVGGQVVERCEAQVGARDTARDGHAGRLRDALHGLIASITAQGPAPARVLAAGMITSAQGLREVPHVQAPAGIAELAAGAEEHVFEDVTPLPLLLVPGVCSVGHPGAADGIAARDVMRGEETLAIGLLRLGVLATGQALLNLGSHWKLLRLDAQGRVAWSVTSLSGELMHSARTHTILAAAVPEGPPSPLDPELVLAGMAEQRRSGLARSLFCVRLLEQAGSFTAQGRLSFLIGAFVAADLDPLRATGALSPGLPVSVSGGEKLGGAWTLALAEAGHPSAEITPSQVEAGFLSGLQAVAAARGGA